MSRTFLALSENFFKRVAHAADRRRLLPAWAFQVRFELAAPTHSIIIVLQNIVLCQASRLVLRASKSFCLCWTSPGTLRGVSSAVSDPPEGNENAITDGLVVAAHLTLTLVLNGELTLPLGA